MTTRRQVLAAAIAAPIASAPVGAFAATNFVCAPMEATPQWHAAVKAMDAARDAYDAYYKTIYEPAFNARKQKRHDEEAELQRRINAIPHYTTSKSYASQSGVDTFMSTRNTMDVRVALDHFNSTQHADDFIACCRELFQAICQRIAQEHEIKEGFTFSEVADMPADIEAEHDRLENLNYAAFRAVTEFEAATPGDLMTKVAFLKEHDCEIDHAEMLADLARVFGRAAQ